MNWFSDLITSSIGKKLLMALTGLFLISFLVVHCTINALIFINDDGETFTHWAHFMGTNPVIRTLEIVLILGFLVHIVQAFILWWQNRRARPIAYAYTDRSKNVTWYSKSMTLLGTLILLFLVVHTSSFWIPNRTSQFTTGEELPLYRMMLEKFQSPVLVAIYLFGCVSLFWHLLHGFKSAFQSLGLKHLKYNGAISVTGIAFSIIVSVIFALMPLSIYFHWIG
jgi:succinate dehydrogenase / fumarate reductase cytochrome b subunit